jgi:DNA-binding MarR family transcriptional regulator
MCQAFDVEQKALTEEISTLGSVLRIPFEAMLAHNWALVRELGFDDVRVAHGAVLRNIGAEGSHISELAARAGMTKQSMAELVGYRARRDYVSVEPDPNDRRGKLVKLTERGAGLFRALTAASDRFEDECRELIGAGEWTRFKEQVTRVARALEPLRHRNGRNLD